MYDLTQSTWYNVIITKSITGKATMVLICETDNDAALLLLALTNSAYTLKTGLTISKTYKVGLFLNGLFKGIELSKNHYQYKELKVLVEGKIKNITTGYYKNDRSLFLNNPIEIQSGQMN